MKCPVCDVALSISSREGIEIDFCPQCRGVWLDRGELDKIIERAGQSVSPSVAAGGSGRYSDEMRPPPRYDDDDRGRRYDERYDDRRGHDDRYDDRDRKRKKRGFLDDLFDFD
jgi:Zn-finger nucleic acid-binding protein